ncbi:hypothetical protein AcV5_005876 [Taiwanofungus camphoratus]|nr:hypothetical protein AcV5_005876 [Antrodia cinnamomea]
MYMLYNRHFHEAGQHVSLRHTLTISRQSMHAAAPPSTVSIDKVTVLRPRYVPSAPTDYKPSTYRCYVMNGLEPRRLEISHDASRKRNVNNARMSY